ncbi:non-specific lipid-transfer protein 1-like [Coffea arabica]|uniref:Non-specific lipid-transfer protein n=1 Tax=Coffea arabica TaxID=13443 RepID=A0A6P6X9R0_COFAR|nr:non-specific lipid-transfer protein 1-like [Coffea arabica]
MANSSAINKQVTLVVFMAMLIMSFSSGGQAQIPCSTVSNDLYPCLSYIMNGGTVDPACCGGIKALINSAKTKTDRQSVCSCLKSFLSNATDGQIKNAAAIPGLCGVKLPVNITRNMDCSKVNSIYY